jgi:hypothetical protein
LARKLKHLNWQTVCLGVLIFLPLHIVPITLFYFPVFGLELHLERQVVWLFGLSGLFGGVAYARREAVLPTSQPTGALRWALLQTTVWFGSIALVLFNIDPAHVTSCSIHQPYGGTSENCEEMESYLFGWGRRKRYLCEEDLSYWQVDHTPEPKDEYYCIKGVMMDEEFFYHMLTSIVFGFAMQVGLLVLAASSSRHKPLKGLRND